MTDDIKAQLDDVDTQEPSMHKIDKKMTIVIFQLLNMQEKINEHEIRIKCAEDNFNKKMGFFSGMAAVIGGIFGSIGWILELMKK